MHPNPRRIAPVIILLAAILALAYWYVSIRPSQTSGSALTASGTIEITQVQLGPELGGRVKEVRVNEGDLVKAGDTLIQLDTALLDAQRSQAAAALSVAKANAQAADASTDAAQSTADAAQASLAAAQASLDLLKAGATTDQIAAAQAQLDQAEAGRLAAEASFSALTAGTRPELVSATRARLDQARQQYQTLLAVLSTGQIDDITTARTTAQTNLQLAQTRLDGLKKNGAMPASAIETASAALADAQAADQAALAALTAAQNAALPFYQQIEAARRASDLAQLNLERARARQALLQGTTDMPQSALDAATSNVEDAQKLADDAKAAFDALDTSPEGTRLKSAWDAAQAAQDDLNRLGRNPTTSVESALNQLDASAAMRDMASANLNMVKSGARSQQISAAQAQVDTAKANQAAAQARTAAAQAQSAAASSQVEMAQAALNLLDVQIGKLTIQAPADGVVMTLAAQPGEIAMPAAALLVLGRLDDKTITVYIPEDVYGQIALGQPALVSVDSFPGRTFNASVVHVADKAEFTPRNVQTVQGRKNTVIAIKLKVTDPDGSLKAGMPADVVFK